MDIYYLPGLASDSSLFCPLIERLGGQCLTWLEPEMDESIQSYSKRFSDEIRKQNPSGIHLVGLCFGGVVSMEIAQHLPLKSLVTINTPGDSKDVSDDFRKGVQIGKKIPLTVLKGLLAMKASSFFKEKDNLNAAQTEAVSQMIKALDIEFLRWAAVASAGWDQPEPLPFSCPHLALHGEKDPIVRPPKRMGFEEMKGVGHLAPITHPDELGSRIQHFWKNIPAQ